MCINFNFDLGFTPVGELLSKMVAAVEIGFGSGTHERAPASAHLASPIQADHLSTHIHRPNDLFTG